jgi:hypothetical protein
MERSELRRKGLSGLAAEALSEATPDKKVVPWDTIRWIFTADSIPTQQDVSATFGDPPLTLFSGPRFHIDVYYWLDGTTSVHQHSFCGAFQVLIGSSIHSQYSFQNRPAAQSTFLGRSHQGREGRITRSRSDPTDSTWRRVHSLALSSRSAVGNHLRSHLQDNGEHTAI